MGVKVENILLVLGPKGWFPLIGRGDSGQHRAAPLAVDIAGLRRLWWEAEFHGRWCPERMDLKSWAPFWHQQELLRRLALHQRWALLNAPMTWAVGDTLTHAAGIGVELIGDRLHAIPVIGDVGVHQVPSEGAPLDVPPRALTSWVPWLQRQTPSDQSTMTRCWSQFRSDLSLHWPDLPVLP